MNSSDLALERIVTAGSLEAAKHICRPARLEHPNISSLLAGLLEAVKHICRPARMQHWNISRLLAGSLEAVNIYVSRHACSTGILHGRWLARLQWTYIY